MKICIRYKQFSFFFLNRIYTVLRAIKQTQASVHKVRSSIEDKLLSSQETTRKKAQHEDLLLKREQLCAEVTWRTAAVNKMKDQADQLHSANKTQGANVMYMYEAEKLIKLNVPVLCMIQKKRHLQWYSFL